MSTQDLNKQVQEGLEKVSEQVDDRFSTLKKRIDTIEKEKNRINGSTFSGKSFEAGLNEALSKNKKQLADLKGGMTKEVRLSLDVKASDMTTTNTYTGEVIPADRLSGVHFDPDRSTHIRQFLPQAPTTSDTVRYVQETAYDDGVEGQAEGTAKGQSDFDVEAKDAPVKTRATFLRVSRQMLDDTSWLTSYINQRTPKKLFLDEDNQILYGDGTGENIEGIAEVAQSYSEILTSGNISNRFDVLTNAVAQAGTQNGEYQANRILINPIDYWSEALAKGDDDHYIHSASVREGNAPLRVAGVVVSPNTAVQSDEFFVGDFNMGATLAMRQGITIGFFEQDADNVTTNKVTVRVEERYALPIHNPNAFIHDRFGSAGVS